MDLNKRLLALSWVMPPSVLPRSIQIARTLAALRRRGWTSRVVTPPGEITPHLPKDTVFAAHYAKDYALVEVEIREDIAPSSRATQRRRLKHPPRDVTEANWLERAASACVDEIDRFAPDALVTFAQPWIDHEIGLAVHARRPTTPWIAHFSDPWVDSPYNIKFPPAAPGELDRWRILERLTVLEADALIFVTEETRSLVIEKYPAHIERKAFVVPHGYDKTILSHVPPAHRAGGRIRMVHTGSIYSGMREPSVLFDALLDLNSQYPLADVLEIEFVGSAPEESRRAAQALPLSDNIRFSGHIGHIESLAAAASADILLLMDAPADRSVFLPSKIVDYLMLGKPILGMTPLDGAAARVLRSAGHVLAPPTDRAAVAAALAGMLDRAKAGEPLAEVDLEAASVYDIQRTTGAFEDILLRTLKKRDRI